MSRKRARRVATKQREGLPSLQSFTWIISKQTGNVAALR